jgi:Ion channel
MEAIYLAVGILVLVLVYWDLFESIVVPRPTPGRFRIARYVMRLSWRVVRRAGRRRDGTTRDTLLGLFAPAVTLALLLVWMLMLILAYSLILFAVRDQLEPVPQDLGATLYLAATTVLTLGGDIAASGPAARVVLVLAAASGLGVVALVVTFLFSLYGSYQRREAMVVTLQAAAGGPPSAVALLETYAQLGLLARLPDLFAEWEVWAAEVLDTHVAYPLLGFFRSSHDNLSWISALGAVLDAASLVLTTIDGLPGGEAELFRRVGAHLTEDISNLGYRAGTADDGRAEERAGLSRAAYDVARLRLTEAGFDLVPEKKAWPAFVAVRAEYAGRLDAMATYWATASTSWLGTGAEVTSPAHRAE